MKETATPNTVLTPPTNEVEPTKVMVPVVDTWACPVKLPKLVAVGNTNADRGMNSTGRPDSTILADEAAARIVGI
jgi:hypothetical protein